MRIRTITTGTELDYPDMRSTLEDVAGFNQRATEAFVSAGFEVQTARISTQPWSDYLGHLTPGEIVAAIDSIGSICADLDVPFISIGAVSGEAIDMVPDFISRNERISAAALITSSKGIDQASAEAASRALKRISRETDRGLGNFRFGSLANCQPDIPFFPGSYHSGDPCFMLGLECGDLVYKAFERAGSLERAPACLKEEYEKALKPLEAIGMELESSEGIAFGGIDVSTAPGLEPTESIAYAFEKLGMGEFGGSGTVTIAAMVTGVLKSLDLRATGYSGLMLPLTEDAGLVERSDGGNFTIHDLLLYSTVCGTGLDAVPLPGDVTEDQVCAILVDMASLAVRLDKPLSARLLPVPGKVAGEMTDFRSPYLIDCRIPRMD
jgi:uncharacterized protein (UPF0210 family)